MRIRMILLLSLFWISCGSGSEKKATANKKEQLPSPKLIEAKVDSALAGSWVLDALPQATVSVEKLFPRQRPMILIQPQLKLISGTTGCNRFSASLTTLGDLLSITDFTRSTLICAGEAESSFLKAFQHSTRYSFRNNEEMVWESDSATWVVFKRR